MDCPVWAEVSREALRHNLRVVKEIVGPSVRVMGIVKANAYGHGLVPVAKILEEAGVDWLGVARGQEALELRREGVDHPILVLGYVHPAECPALLAQEVTLTAYSEDILREWAGIAQREGKRLKVHFKVDTGMGRLGFKAEPAGKEAILRLAALPRVEVEGIYTHFACADLPDEKPTRDQLEKFIMLLEELERAGLSIPLRHAANSAALIRFRESHLDMVRPGIMLYGLLPFPSARVNLSPAMTLKARVVQVKRVGAGFPVSYGWTYRTSRPSLLATVAAGYGDGYSRLLSNKGEVLLRGRRVPVVGRVCMDQLIVDATELGEVEPGEEVVLFGRQGEVSLPVEELAEKIGTINYEVVCAVSARVPRVYL
ncbi:alanine racemase [Ammonifex degensii KC4]|uniref:Alanine racemase n=1 Tax=Ammonifex degensii (strain DSM 10501 / KC4) TaxID=429009 RepID=C9R968_AMMDK|nr:alanine racemase [Ammonifex degensii]ACX52847.1 alanine racemase [Ammonifex degensii KC4]